MIDNGEGESSKQSTMTTPKWSDREVDAEGSESSTPPASAPASSQLTEDRGELLTRARTFLRSPTIVHEDVTTKRKFLTDKGLRDDEIESLMRELPPQPPPIPPRTYPQPPPSNLPRLLLGLTRIFSWITGGSAILILIYYRFLLPRITRSSLARRALKQHQVALLKRLNSSLAELKASQTETFAVLPVPNAPYEPKEFSELHDLEKLGLERDTPIDVPEFTFLRCAIEGLLAEGKKVTKEELFAYLEERYSWSSTAEGLAYQNSLWETLKTNPCFSETKEDNRLIWTYTPTTSTISSTSPTPLLTSLQTLKITIPAPFPRIQTSPIQRTLDALTDFTGYITTQTYQFASGAMRHQQHGLGQGYYSNLGYPTQLTPQQEEVKKEIRALKGLVLNRRTFAPTAIRPSSYTPMAPTP